jgi:hypothetical protein
VGEKFGELDGAARTGKVRGVRRKVRRVRGGCEEGENGRVGGSA